MTNFVKLIIRIISIVRRDPTAVPTSFTSVYVVTGTTAVSVDPSPTVASTVTSAQNSAATATVITGLSSVPPLVATATAVDDGPPTPSYLGTTGIATAITLASSSAPANTLQTIVVSSAVSGGSVISATFAVPISSTTSSIRVSSLTSASAKPSMSMVAFTSTYTITYNGSYVSYSPNQATSSIISAIPSSIKSIASTNDVIATLALDQQFVYGDPPWFTTLPYDITQYYHSSSSLMTLFSYVATAHNAVAPSPTNQGGGGGLGTAASIGIGVGAGVGGLLLLIGLVFGLLYRRRQKKRRLAAAPGQDTEVQEKREYKSELPGGPVSRAELPDKDVDEYKLYDNRANIQVYGQGRAEMSAVNY